MTERGHAQLKRVVSEQQCESVTLYGRDVMAQQLLQRRPRGMGYGQHAGVVHRIALVQRLLLRNFRFHVLSLE